MAILGCNFNINFGQTLAPGSSLCNTLRTKLHAWPASSIIVEVMVKFLWEHSLPVGSYHTFKMPTGRLDFWCSKLKLREVSQTGFWNTSLHPTSVSSFSQIGWPQLLAPGSLSQTKTLKTTTSTPTPLSSKVEGIFAPKKSPGHGCYLQLNMMPIQPIKQQNLPFVVHP